jgi:hypothetical protein
MRDFSETLQVEWWRKGSKNILRALARLMLILTTAFVIGMCYFHATSTIDGLMVISSPHQTLACLTRTRRYRGCMLTKGCKGHGGGRCGKGSYQDVA